MQGIKRRVVYVTLYEVLAISLTSVLLARLTNSDVTHAGVVAVVESTIAVFWSLGFNYMFEAWESRQVVRGRSIARRAAHAIGFEGGLIVLLMPMFMWWLELSFLDALAIDIGLLLFFLAFTYAFNWTFDHIFGLPLSAQPL